MSDDLVKRARGVLSGVTPGPWRLRPDDEEDEPAQCIRARGFDIATCWGGYIAGDSDARFIAAARELVPAMADRIEELEAKLAKVVEALESAQESIATFIGVHGYTEESGATDVLDQVSAAIAEINGGGDT